MTQLQTELFNNTEASKEKYIDYNEASRILGVSVATLRNWVKANYIKPEVNGINKPLFNNSEILVFKEKLATGETDKLKSRANKRNSKLTFVPTEYLHNKGDYDGIIQLLSSLNELQLPIATVMLLLSINLLNKSGLITNDLNEVNEFSELKFRNENVKKVISEWWNESSKPNLNKYHSVLTIPLRIEGDFLGVVYQSLIEEGNKAQGGSYYTPAKVVNSIVEEYSNSITQDTIVLDPCCGTGQFLLSFSRFLKNPSNLWGYDIDEIAVNITRINLLLKHPTINFFPNVYRKNTLETKMDIKFDIVATNPPWGYHFSTEELSNLDRLYPTILSKEAFSYFILKGLELLRENGKLTYVLPEALLKVKQHSDVRKHILDNASISKISHLGNVFLNVLSPVITLSLKKEKNTNNTIAIRNKTGKDYSIAQSRFLSNVFHTFDTGIASEDKEIIEKIYRKPHQTLENKADWALGIVTGNNKAFLTTTKTKDNEGILKGSDIKKYYFDKPKNFITFEPEKFQQVAPTWKYRTKEKLIYKFISDTLVFAYDNGQILTLNSANILIPKLENYPIKLTLALLNSSLFQYLYKKTFNTIKVLRGDLEKLPFPKVDENTSSQITQITDKLITRNMNDQERAKHISLIDNMIFSIFELNDTEVAHIKLSIEK